MAPTYSLRIPKPRYIAQQLLGLRSDPDYPIAQEELQNVLENYALSPWECTKNLGGGSSLNVLLKTASGPKVLKQYLWSLPSTEQEHSIVTKLTQLQFPTPALIPNNDGQTYTRIGNKHYGLYEFHQGYNMRSYLLSTRQRLSMVALAGSTLSYIHLHLKDFCPSGRKFNGFMPSKDRLWRDAPWQMDTIDKFLSEKRNTEAANFISNISNELQDLIAQTRQYFEPGAVQLPRSIIHGDYAPHNILFKSATELSVLDLGDACVNLRAIDLARALTTFARSSQYDLDRQTAQAFLTGYRQHVTPYESELAAIADLIQWRYLQNMIWKLNSVMESTEDVGNIHNLLQERWRAIEWLQANGHRWSKILQ